MEKIYVILQELRPEFNFYESDNFIEDGFLDSFDKVSLISSLEEEYEILIDGLDILPENFCNVEAIANVIKKNGGKIEWEQYSVIEK